MIFVKHSDIKWSYSEKHDMDAGVHNDLPANESADIIFARIRAGHTLTPHWHVRPKDQKGQDGYESFFFFNGGKIKVIRKNESKIIDLNEPFTLTFHSGQDDMHGIVNLDDKDVEFQVLCAPRFLSDEERF